MNIYQLGKRAGAFLRFSGTSFLFINGISPVYSHSFNLTSPTLCLEQRILLKLQLLAKMRYTSMSSAMDPQELGRKSGDVITHVEFVQWCHQNLR